MDCRTLLHVEVGPVRSDRERGRQAIKRGLPQYSVPCAEWVLYRWTRPSVRPLAQRICLRESRERFVISADFRWTMSWGSCAWEATGNCGQRKNRINSGNCLLWLLTEQSGFRTPGTKRSNRNKISVLRTIDGFSLHDSYLKYLSLITLIVVLEGNWSLNRENLFNLLWRNSLQRHCITKRAITE